MSLPLFHAIRMAERQVSVMAKYPEAHREKHWHGRFYCNREDRRIFIRRRGGLLAWTINYANWRSWALIAAEIAVILAILSFFNLL